MMLNDYIGMRPDPQKTMTESGIALAAPAREPEVWTGTVAGVPDGIPLPKGAKAMYKTRWQFIEKDLAIVKFSEIIRVVGGAMVGRWVSIKPDPRPAESNGIAIVDSRNLPVAFGEVMEAGPDALISKGDRVEYRTDHIDIVDGLALMTDGSITRVVA